MTIDKSLGFIGCGRLTRLLFEGLLNSGCSPGRMVFSDPDAATLAQLSRFLSPVLFLDVELLTNGNPLAASQDIVFLALHPPVIPVVAAQIKSSLRPDAIVVSFAPKVTLAKLSELLGGFLRVARVIPNAPSIVNAGFNPMACSPALTASDRYGLRKLVAVWGDCPEVAEAKLEAYALLTALGPAYFWFQFYELLKLAREFGLTEEEARIGLENLLFGAVKTMNTPNIEAAEVMDLISLKPLAEMEPQFKEQLRARLTVAFRELKP